MGSDHAKKAKAYKKNHRDAKHGTTPHSATQPPPPPPPPELECSGELADAEYFLKNIKFQHLDLSLHGEDLIAKSTLNLVHGSCYGIVNSQRCGEGTLFRAMAQGLLPFPQYFDVSYPVYKPEYGYAAVRKYVTSHEGVIKQIELGQAILASMSNGGNSEAMECLNERYKTLEESSEEFAAEILYGLGFDKHMQSGRADSLHSRWEKPLALARTLFLRPQVILLDEPTEYLDLERCVWLAKWIEDNLKGKCIVIIKSNDEDFLNQVCRDFLYLQNCEVHHFSGNYQGFLEAKLNSHAVVQLDRLAFIKRPLDKNLVPPILQLLDATFGYGDMHVFENVELDVTLSSRVAIVGNRGSGKTNLLEVLSGTRGVQSGTRNTNSNLSIGYYYSGLLEELNLSLTALDYLNSFFKRDKKLIKEVIEYAQPGTLLKPIGSLSHGQRTLLVLARLASQNHDILVLDEPCKGLDVESMESIARALQNWNGSFILASNNVKLIHRVTSDIWVCGSLGLTKYNGSILDLKLKIQKDNKSMAGLQNPAVIRGTYPQFGISIGDGVHPTVWYKESIDEYDVSFKSVSIPFAEYTKNRAMVSNAPSAGLKKGEMDFPLEHDSSKTYRMITDPGKRIGRSLLGTIQYAELARECFSDFDASNVMVTPHGTIRLKRVKRKKFCPHQIRRNYMAVRKILEDMCSVGGAVPEEVQFLLDMIRDEPELSAIFPIQAALVPLCNIAAFFTKLFEHLLRFMKDTALVDSILLKIPYIGTDQDLMAVQHAGPKVWHKLMLSNSILEKTYNHVKGKFVLLPLQPLQGNVIVTPQQLRERRLLDARNFLTSLRNRVSHRMDYQDKLSVRYRAKGSDLATHARFSMVNCVLQKELHKAKETEHLHLDEFSQEKV